ncbi:MAG: tetratricopeptide repeat protein [Minwuia sp.]|uniref:tetratricopeptide repeat protein n=1 Tax=Minwuia sp. TaxID=2493630 RepID=UPI003A83F5CB
MAEGTTNRPAPAGSRLGVLLAIAIAAVALGFLNPRPAAADDPGRDAFIRGAYAEAMDVWLPLAEAGDAHAQFNIGLMHDEGLGTAPDQELARIWWTRAAEQGLAEAHHNLALLEIELASRDLGGDIAAAVGHLESAAETGHLQSHYTLGKLYEVGLGVEKDMENSVRHILTAAEGGFARAQYNMGKRYRDGDGVEQDSKISTEWFRRAAMQGHPGGMDHLARRLHEGDGVEQDDVQAMAFAILAARKGYPDARELADSLKAPLSIDLLDEAFSKANAFEPEVVTGPVD